jgi:flagellar hook protein FlgE
MSFFTSLSGMKNAETDLRVISHNIANAETVGFKKSKASFGDLAGLFARPARADRAEPRPRDQRGRLLRRGEPDFGRHLLHPQRQFPHRRER